MIRMIFLMSFGAWGSPSQSQELWQNNGFTNVVIEDYNVDTSYLNSLKINIYTDNSSQLSTIDFQAQLQVLNDIYAQCEIGISSFRVIRTDSFRGIQRWDQFETGQPHSIETLRGAAPIDSNEIVIFYLPASSVGDYSGFSYANWTNRVGLRPNLFNTIWIFDYSLSQEYQNGYARRYDLLAHELLHVLTLEGQHISERFRSLMSVSRGRTNTILEENCELARGFFNR